MTQFLWRTNLRTPFDRVDAAWLARVGSYKIGAPQIATGRENALSKDALEAAGIVGIYAPDEAMGPDVMGAFERAAEGAPFEALGCHLASRLDEHQHLRPPA